MSVAFIKPRYMVYTLRPSPYEMNNVVNKVLEKFPHISTLKTAEAKHVSPL